MPELNNIQTFEVIDEDTYKVTLNKFQAVLQKLGIWNKAIEKSFSNFHWKVADDGFIYSIINADYVIYEEIPVRPYALVFTSAVDHSYHQTWMSIQLLIPTESIRPKLNYTLKKDTLKRICRAFADEFNQTGVYFTDEAQDGIDFDGIRTNNKADLWQFDYALIPKELSKLYGKCPDEMIALESNEKWTEYSRKGLL